MATLNLSSPTHSLYSLRLHSNHSHTINTPALSFHSLINPAAALFRSTPPKHRSPAKHRRRGLVVSALKKLSETESVTVSSDAGGNFPSASGVYAIYDSSGDLQFVGITRNLAASVIAHKNSLPELCCAVKVSNFVHGYFTVLRNA